MRLLVPTDFSDTADRALAMAVRLARALGAEVVLLHVVDEAPLFADDLGGIPGGIQIDRIHAAQERWADEHLRPRVAGLTEAGLRARGHVTVGSPAREVVRAAEGQHADLIVMGTHGRGLVGRLLLGSVADRVIRTAACPVLTVRGPVPQ